MTQDSVSAKIKEIKRQFMAFRNGIVSDTLRKAGFEYDIIFGLQLPQISQIAAGLPKDSELALALWQDSSVRESRLLACYLFPPEDISMEKAEELASNVRNTEEADILAFRLLRRLPFAQILADKLSASTSEGAQKSAKALLRNIS
ncbi:MAG: DNA alkylation repair protein [Muribaculum sp.]|nr:DNA alkylation repair protein [Muribaculum sp.]